MQVFDNFFLIFGFSETGKAKNGNSFQHVGGMMTVFSYPTKNRAGLEKETFLLMWQKYPMPVCVNQSMA